MKPFWIMLRAIGIIWAVEILIMFYLESVGLDHGLLQTLLDATLLAGITAPLLYYWVIQHMAQQLSTNRFQEMVQGVRAVVWEANPSPLSLTYVNRHVEELLGYPASQCLAEGGFWAAHTHPDDYARVLKAFSDAHSQGENCELEYRLLAADGSIVWVRDQVTPFPGTHGNKDQLRGVMVNITERRRSVAALKESEERLRDFLDNASDLIQSIAPEGQILYANRAWRETLGYREEEITQLSMLDIIHPDQRQHCGALLQRIMEGEQIQQIDTVFVAKDGRQIMVSGSVNCRYEHGQPVFTRGIFRDVTERRRAQTELEASNRRLTHSVGELERRGRKMDLLNEMGDLLLVPLSFEEAYKVITEYGQRLFPGDSGVLFVYRSSRNALESVAHWGTPGGEMHWFAPEQCWALRRGKMYLGSESGSALPCAHVGAALREGSLCVPMIAQGEVFGVLHLQLAAGSATETGTFERGWSEVKQRLAVSVAEHVALALANLNLRETLRNQSIRDPLTGLFNRRYMEESLEREYRRASRKGQMMGAIMMDLDHFKSVNDTLGHEAGDALLKEVGAFLQKYSRKDDIACRYGGEEFLLILPDITLEILQQRAENLRVAIKTLKVAHRGKQLNAPTMSVGVASLPANGSTTEDLLRSADTALYRAKHEGRDRVVVAAGVLST